MRLKPKIALVPEERRKQGVFLSEDIISHTNLHQSGWKRKQTELNDATTKQFLLSVFHQMTQRHLFIHLAVETNKKSQLQSGVDSNLIYFF